MAALEAATQRARVGGRKRIHAESRRTRRRKNSADPASPRETRFISLADARWLGGRVKPGHGEFLRIEPFD
jgi:hypothetical protein